MNYNTVEELLMAIVDKENEDKLFIAREVSKTKRHADTVYIATEDSCISRIKEVYDKGLIFIDAPEKRWFNSFQEMINSGLEEGKFKNVVNGSFYDLKERQSLKYVTLEALTLGGWLEIFDHEVWL